MAIGKFWEAAYSNFHAYKPKHHNITQFHGTVVVSDSLLNVKFQKVDFFLFPSFFWGGGMTIWEHNYKKICKLRFAHYCNRGWHFLHKLTHWLHNWNAIMISHHNYEANVYNRAIAYKCIILQKHTKI